MCGLAMNEKEVVEALGTELAQGVCRKVVNGVKSLRARHGVPIGQREVQYEVAIKSLMGKGELSMDTGRILLKDLTDETINAVLRVSGTDPKFIGVWLL